MKCKSFAPRIDDNSKILILGSMPSIKSLEMRQYYANPQNRFWTIMGKLCRCENLKSAGYESRIKILLDNKFALWDIIKECSREGSADSNIKGAVPNDIPGLLDRYPNIEKIYINGHGNYSAFEKLFPALTQKYKCFKKLSTSSANAKRMQEMFDDWTNEEAL